MYTQVNVGECLASMYPSADPVKDYIVFDEGEGQFIKEWNLPYPQPTEEELIGGWIAILKQKKIAEFHNLCTETIMLGFTSRSMGYQYGFNELDQMNMTQQMLLFLNKPELTIVDWKTEDAGVITHTRQQFLTVVTEADTHKRGWINYYWNKKIEINNQTTVEGVHSVEW